MMMINNNKIPYLFITKIDDDDDFYFWFKFFYAKKGFPVNFLIDTIDCVCV